MNNQQHNALPEGMSTLSECMDIVASRGYTAAFMVAGSGLHIAGQEDRYYQPEETHMPGFYRFEGISNPDDMSILYLIETVDGTKGTLVDAYGTYADSRINDFVRAVQDIHKSVDS